MQGEKSLVQSLLHAPVVQLAIGGKLAVPEVFQNLTLAVRFVEGLQQAKPQLLKFGDLFLTGCNAAGACPVATQFETQFGRVHALAEFLRELFAGPAPFLFGLCAFLVRPGHFAGRDLQSQTLALLVTLAIAEECLEREVESHEITSPGVPGGLPGFQAGALFHRSAAGGMRSERGGSL